MTYPEKDLEVPEVDAAEQAAEAAPGWLEDAPDEVEASRAIEVSEWDAHEQAQVVELEDDYR